MGSVAVATADEEAAALLRVYREAMRSHYQRYIDQQSAPNVSIETKEGSVKTVSFSNAEEHPAPSPFVTMNVHYEIKVASTFVPVMVDFVRAVTDLSLCLQRIQAGQKINLSQRDRVKTHKVEHKK